MRIDWGLCLTIFIAVLMAELIERGLFQGRSEGSSTRVTAQTQSPAEPKVIYANPIQQFLHEHYSDACR